MKDEPTTAYWYVQCLANGTLMPMKNARVARAVAIVMEESTSEKWRPVRVALPDKYWVTPTYPPDVDWTP